MSGPEMENVIYPSQTLETVQIKVEVSDTEVTSSFHQERPVKCYIKEEDIKVENTDFEWHISKYECGICEEIFTEKFTLEDHIDQYHQSDNEKPLQSALKTEPKDNDYGEYSKTNSDLTRNATVHNNKTIPKCRLTNCEKSSKKNKSLDSENFFHCNNEGCDKVYKTKYALLSHINEHHNKTTCTGQQNEVKLYKCEYDNCGKSFDSNSKLNVHSIVHSNNRLFKCEVPGCTKSFKRNNEKKCHMRIHSDEKLFKCSYPNCIKAFKTRSDMTKHAHLHSDNKPFGCTHEGCGKAFKRKWSLKKHQTTHSLRTNNIE